MLWQGKEIKTLSDDELQEAIHSLAHMDNYRFDKLNDPRIKRPNHRLNKIFERNPPVENPAFTNLLKELQDEFTKRNPPNQKSKTKSKRKLKNVPQE